MKLVEIFSGVSHFILLLVPNLQAWNLPEGSNILNFMTSNPDNSTLSGKLLKRYKYSHLDPESTEVEDLIKELDLKRFLKQIPLVKLKKLKTLSRTTPIAAQDYFLHLAKDSNFNNGNQKFTISPNKSPKCVTENSDPIQIGLQKLHTTKWENDIKTANQQPENFESKNKYKLKLKLSEKMNFKAPDEIHKNGFIPFKPSPEIIEGAINKYSVSQNEHVAEGSYGPFSWSIEPATVENLQSETLLSPTAVLNAITQAENEKNKLQRYTNKPETNQYANLSSSYNFFNKFLAPSSSQTVPYTESALTSAVYPQPSSVNYSPTKYKTSNKPEHYYNVEEESPVYYSDSEYEFPWSTSHKKDSIGDWIWKVKSIFQGSSTGGYKTDAITKKLLEITIGVLAFLAFGGYIATITFQSLLPTLRPIISNKINKKNNITVTNGNGLLGLLLGRSIKLENAATPELLPLDYIISTFIHQINSKDLE